MGHGYSRISNMYSNGYNNNNITRPALYETQAGRDTSDQANMVFVYYLRFSNIAND